FFVQGAWGVIPAHINELAPDGVRGFLPGFSYQCGVAIASQIPHVQALFAAHTSYAQTMALSAALVFVVGALVALAGPERRGVASARTARSPAHSEAARHPLLELRVGPRSPVPG